MMQKRKVFFNCQPDMVWRLWYYGESFITFPVAFVIVLYDMHKTQAKLLRENISTMSYIQNVYSHW